MRLSLLQNFIFETYPYENKNKMVHELYSFIIIHILKKSNL